MTGRGAAASAAAALAALPGMGPVGLGRLLVEAGGPVEAWEWVCRGRWVRPSSAASRAAQAGGSWAGLARGIDVEQRWQCLAAEGVQVTWWGGDDYPAVLVDDPLPPPVLFWRGDLRLLQSRRVAVVGTRRCTPDGAATACQLGRDLAAAGVVVVSGLALGIDGAAHRGALASARGLEGAGIEASARRQLCAARAEPAGPPDAGGPGGAPVRGRSVAAVAVAGSGVDRPYPARHADLWEQVATSGLLLSEAPPGQPAQAWRFPARNRIIAALAEVVVVVESHVAGGSLLTVDEALARGVEVAAVPGPVRSPASGGTNQLLVDGAIPVRHAGDVLGVLGFPATEYGRAARTGRGSDSGRRDGHRCAVGTTDRGSGTGRRSDPGGTGADPGGVPGAGAGVPGTGAGVLGTGAGIPGAVPAEPGVVPCAAPAERNGDPASSPVLDPHPDARQPPPDADPEHRRRVLECVGWRPTSLTEIVERSGLAFPVVAATLVVMSEGGELSEEGGWWQRRT